MVAASASAPLLLLTLWLPTALPGAGTASAAAADAARRPEVSTCGTGLTISGSPNAALNADYYADTFSQCGATNFQVKSETPTSMQLGSSFLS